MFRRHILLLLSALICFSCMSIGVFAASLDELTDAEISAEPLSNVTQDLSLILEFNGLNISWSSSAPEIISPQGKIVRPMPGEADAEVLLTASTQNNSKSFTVIVKPFASYLEVIKKVKSALSFESLSSESINLVTNDFTLPATSLYGSAIYWTSTDESVVAIDGSQAIVKRPPTGEGDATVVLTAHISLGDSYGKKYFLLSVPEHTSPYTGYYRMKDACDEFHTKFIRAQNIVDLRSDLNVPEVTDEDVLITCSSSNAKYLSNDGVITRPITEDVLVNYTVTFSLGYEKARRTYPIIVKAIEEDAILLNIENDLDWLINQLNEKHKLDRLTENLKLEQKGPYGTVFTYTSSDDKVISSEGVVNRQDNTQEILLTVLGVLYGESLSRSVNIKVLGKDPGQTSKDESGSQESSGGSKGSGGGKLLHQIESEIIKKDSIAFSDVSSSHWAYEAITELYDMRIINGIGDGRFAPDAPVTREQFVKLLVEAPLRFTVDSYEVPFKDVNLNAWYYPYVSTAYYYSIIKGISEEKFGIGLSISRQDLAVIVSNCIKRLENVPIENKESIEFDDTEKISDYAKNAVLKLKALGLVSGKDENKFYPHDTLTRAEAALIIYRLLKLR